MDAVLSKHELLVVLDFGSQYSHLIARRLRESNIYCELLAYDTPAATLRALSPRGLILSGGPSSVYEEDAPHADVEIFSLSVPVLGICYGMQEMASALGGSVTRGEKQEFGSAELRVEDKNCGLFQDVPRTSEVWMSHGDKVVQLPRGFAGLARTDTTEYAAVADTQRNLFGLQFHPEVTHTPKGTIILRNFARLVCGCSGDWTMQTFANDAISAIRDTVGNGRVVGAVSGGVDSTVAAALVARAVGKQFNAVMVDNGLLRMNEASEVLTRLRDRCGVNLSLVEAENLFLERLADVTDPEKKRKVIGITFIELFEREAVRIDADFLLQGTLYPDVIESVSHKGPSATIKTHHNVGGLPQRMRLVLIEPLRFLFKDEVRTLGLELGIERESIFRHPFPGPGLAIRILGTVTPDRLRALREADSIYLGELRAAGLYDKIGQAFAVLLPVKAVGVMGDRRTYEEVVTLRAVKTTDYMTADWFDIPTPVLRKVSTRIVNEVAGVNRVTYDITSKPPGTIEWE